MLVEWVTACWDLLLDSAIYVIFGILVAGLIRAFLSPGTVASHLGEGKAGPVFKAALWGIPMPLCSCGVLPAAASLRKQGATKGATTAFLISTPESGVDSIAITYALLDPLLTIARPVAAFVTALSAGLAEAFLDRKVEQAEVIPDLTCPVDGCCDGKNCPIEVHKNHHTRREKLKAGLDYAHGELWGDLASWFFAGILLAGLITALLPPEILSEHLGGGPLTMLIMLAVGIPIYICATSSTPIAAALLLKGISPGAALVFLLAGPATNVTSLTVLVKVLGKRATAIYLASIAIFAVLCGLALDWVYGVLGIDPAAIAGTAGEVMPLWVKWLGVLALSAISLKPLSRMVQGWFRAGRRQPADQPEAAKAEAPTPAAASCSGST